MSGHDRIGLIGDIGGTNARFAIADLSGPPTFRDVIKLKAADYPSLADAARAYLDQVPLPAPPRHAVLAVAGPPDRGVIAMTNHVWRASLTETRDQLGMAQVAAVNDFEAIAHAVPALAPEHLTPIGEVPAPAAAAVEKRAITGPGTGLGVAQLVGTAGRTLVIPTEGGHVSFAPQSDRQREIDRVLRHDYPRLSVERLISGPGLINLHRALAKIEDVDAPDLQPSEITRLARSGDQLCRLVLEEFFAIFGAFCGDLALISGARHGVLIAGGILPPLADLLAASDFRTAFQAKGRFSGYVQAVPTQLICHPDPGLLGAAALLKAFFRREEARA
ncbi:MAG: glucokinase [Rhodothalassiaceae bacterium]